MEVLGKDIRLFQETISNHSTYDFSQYSHTSLRRRLTRLLLEYETNIEGLTRRMRSDPVFMEQIIRKLTVHTTELFRDPEVWIRIGKEIIPGLSDRQRIRIWHPGCSTGQEVYSMMMLLDTLGLLEKTDIYGTDINPDVIDTARAGTYKYRFNQSYLENFEKVITGVAAATNPPGSIHAQRFTSEIPDHLPAQESHSEGITNSRNNRKLWKKYFHVDEASDQIRMKETLRNKPVWRTMDLVKDANPFLVKFDLIICRNVIIYFNNELQNRVFDLFHRNMNDYGSLVLGVHETILGPFTKKFIKRGEFYWKGTV